MRKFLILIFFFLVLCGSKASAEGSQFKVYFEKVEGNNLSVDVKLDASLAVNALHLEVNYPKDKLKFVGSSNAGSIIDLWQGKPKTLSSSNILITGALLKSWNGEGGQVIRLNFLPENLGEATVSTSLADIYLADGKGTKVEGEKSSLTLNILEMGTEEFVEEKRGDPTPPNLVLSLIKNPVDGSPFISFYANDPESGIKTAEMRTKKWFTYGEWVEAENPISSPRDAWKIELRAINNDGLETKESEIIFNLAFLRITLLIIFILLLVFLKFYIFPNPRAKKLSTD